MNVPPRMAELQAAGPPGMAGGREVNGHLRFIHGGGRTVLARQHVPYPFHITRPFTLDRRRPELAALYLQSCSGGLYAGDRLRLGIEVAGGAQAHVTSQAATVVHRTAGEAACFTTTARIEAGALLALTNDPFVLFPDAHLDCRTEVTLMPGGRAILADGFATHDPAEEGRPFGALRTELCVRDGDGKILVRDRGALTGLQFAGPASPLGPYRAMGGVVALGEPRTEIDVAGLMRPLDALECRIGASELPNGCGIAVRCLAPTGGHLARGLLHVFAAVFRAWTGDAAPTLRK